MAVATPHSAVNTTDAVSVSGGDNDQQPNLLEKGLGNGEVALTTIATTNTTGDGANHNKRPECFSSTLQEVLFVLSCTMAIGQSSFFAGTIVGLTATIGADLNMTSAEITWISASASLSAGAFLLFFGKVADMFGRKVIFVASQGLFAICLLILGFSKTAIFMDCFCGIMGLCNAAVVPPAIGTLGAVYDKPSKRKNAAFGCFSAGNPMGFVLGAVMAGIANKIFNWRAAFWLLSIVYALFTTLTIWTVPRDVNQVKTKLDWESLKKFDVLGTVLAVSGIALFSSSLTLSGNAPQGWKTPYVIATLVIGLVLIGCFIYWQKVFKYPLMPLGVWKDRNFSLLNLISCFGFMNFTVCSFWTSLYLQRLRNASALEVALQLLPQAIGGIIVNIVVALILHRVSNKLLMAISTVSYTVSALLLGFMKEDSIYWAYLFPALLLSVVGADIQFSVANMYVMSSLPSAQQSVAGGMFNTVSKLCQNIGLGISTAIYTSVGGTDGAGAAAGGMGPYSATFHFAAAIAGISMFLVPFLTLGTQGGKVKMGVEKR